VSLTLEQLYHKTFRTGRSSDSQPALLELVPIVADAPVAEAPERPRRRKTARKTVLLHAGTGTQTVTAALRGLGAKPVVVDSPDDAYGLDFDAVLLLGGADISPQWYGERALLCGPINKSRDLIEWTLARRALSDGKPIMGICRGHQMLAAAAGGSLYQDLLGYGVTPQSHEGGRHALVDVTRPLARHMPSLTVNSYHHQAIKTPPPGFDVAAYAPDGVVEAIWRPGALGVQFHPELLLAGGKTEWLLLFEWFLEGLA